MKKLLVAWIIILMGSSGLITNALAANIAYNANVTLHGTFFTGGWGGTTVVGPETIVNGVFLPETTQWDEGSVWWDTSVDPNPQYITIDLGGFFNIDSFIVQADNNDTYQLEYYDNGSLDWVTIGPLAGYGLMTRPEIFLPDTIKTSALRFMAIAGDGYYSVSEIQAFGEAAPDAIPEPGTMFLFATGILAAAACRRNY